MVIYPKTKAFLPIIFLVILLSGTILFVETVSAETVDGWTVMSGWGNVSETDDILTFSGNDQVAGAILYTYISPQSDFDISIDVKAETLGQVNRDPSGAGEGFMILLRPNASVFNEPIGINFEFRARGGGQFLVTRHNTLCDIYNWQCDWTPFVYNSLAYNDGSAFWTYASDEARANAPVKADEWYTMTLKVKQNPFVITAEVFTENGTLLGVFPTMDMNNFGFDDIKCVGLSSAFGGTFYVKNITGVFTASSPQPTPTTEPSLNSSITIATDTSATVGSLVNVTGNLCGYNGSPLVNQSIVLLYTFNGADSWIPMTAAQTDANGQYSIQWMNIATGTYTLKAQWNGNSLYNPASAVTTLSSLPSVQDKIFFVESNSTVSYLAFNSSTLALSFTVSGPSGTKGYTKVTIAKTLCPSAEGITVNMDGKPFEYVLSDSGDSLLLSFTYSHSSHSVDLYLPQTEPSQTTAQSPVQPNPTQDLGFTLIAVGVASALLVTVGVAVWIKRKR